MESYRQERQKKKESNWSEQHCSQSTAARAIEIARKYAIQLNKFHSRATNSIWKSFRRSSMWATVVGFSSRFIHFSRTNNQSTWRWETVKKARFIHNIIIEIQFFISFRLKLAHKRFSKFQSQAQTKFSSTNFQLIFNETLQSTINNLPMHNSNSNKLEEEEKKSATLCWTNCIFFFLFFIRIQQIAKKMAWIWALIFPNQSKWGWPQWEKNPTQLIEYWILTCCMAPKIRKTKQKNRLRVDFLTTSILTNWIIFLLFSYGNALNVIANRSIHAYAH